MRAVRAELVEESASRFERNCGKRGAKLDQSAAQVAVFFDDDACLARPGGQQVGQERFLLVGEMRDERVIELHPETGHVGRTGLERREYLREKGLESQMVQRRWNRVGHDLSLDGATLMPETRRGNTGGFREWVRSLERIIRPYAQRLQHCRMGASSILSPARVRGYLMNGVAAPSSPPMPSPAETTVLIVDDNEANRLLARDTLEDEGYQVVLASSGKEALALFEATPVDCVLLDIRMPEMDGFTVCERIRELPRGADMPVVFLTAQRDVDTFDRALHSGGDDFLTKPVRPTELIIRVQSAVKLRQLRSALREHYDLLKHQRDDLMRLQLQKERLTAFLVHDLKNPVSAMDLHAQVLLRDKTLSQSTRESVEQIRESARRLSRMILNLLDLSKGDEGKLTAKKSRVELRPLARRVEAELEVSARERGLRLESKIDADSVEADEDLLQRTLVNLVENAVRHGPRDSAVRLDATRRDGVVEIRVSDAGKGIPPELRTAVFEPFVQIELKGAQKSRGGYGLGLTFCRLAVEAHGGTIHVEDANPGAAFVLRLPDPVALP